MREAWGALAGYVDPGSGRFIRSGNAPEIDRSLQQERRRGGSGGDGGDQTDIDPIIHGLLARLPKSGEIWPEAERKLWLDLLAGSFKLIYKDKDDAHDRETNIDRS
jgi:hypothetical protein